MQENREKYGNAWGKGNPFDGAPTAIKVNQGIMAGLFAGAALSVVPVPFLGRVAPLAVPTLRNKLRMEAATALAGAAKSVWKQNPFSRGRVIEKLMGMNLHPNFPVIDRFANGVATSIKSLDVNAKSYQDAGSVYGKIKDYVDSVASFNGAVYGGNSIDASEIQSRALDLVLSDLPSSKQLCEEQGG
jgi:hypothetical protein